VKVAHKQHFAQYHHLASKIIFQSTENNKLIPGHTNYDHSIFNANVN